MKKEPNESEYHGFTTKSRKVRNRKITSQKVLPANRKDDFIQSQNFSNRNNVSFNTFFMLFLNNKFDILARFRERNE